MNIHQNVLIIDDDVDFTFLLRHALRGHGVNAVESVTSGKEAAKYIAGLFPYQNRILPDLLFVDLKMDGMDGLELMAWMRRDPSYKFIPFIILSGSMDPEDRNRLGASRAQAFYEKPNQLEDLRAIVKKELEERTLEYA